MEPIGKHLKDKAGKKKNTIHSSKHDLAKELSEYFNEPKDYRKYLGVCFMYPEEKLRAVYAEIKEDAKRNFKIVPVKLFFWKLKEIPKLNKKSKIKDKNLKTKSKKKVKTKKNQPSRASKKKG